MEMRPQPPNPALALLCRSGPLCTEIGLRAHCRGLLIKLAVSHGVSAETLKGVGLMGWVDVWDGLLQSDH